MANIDVEWSLRELRHYRALTDSVPYANEPGGVMVIGTTTRGSGQEIDESAYVVEQILDRVLPGWRSGLPTRGSTTSYLREQAARAIAHLKRDSEIRERLGDNAPVLDAGRLHHWVWDGAKSLWQSGHFSEAVTAAAKKLNAETQNKVGRRDLGEVKLFQESFSVNDPEPGKSRLRVADTESPSYRDRQVGAIKLAEALFGGVRNPASHEAGIELPQDEALEQLAAFSMLARLVDRATLDTTSG